MLLQAVVQVLAQLDKGLASNVGFSVQKGKNGGGAGGRTRTDTMLPSEDFESSASTSFTTPAQAWPVSC